MTEHAPLTGGNCATNDCPEHPFILEASDGSGFASNALRFADAEAAAQWGSDLSMRWFALRAYRVIDTRDGSAEREVTL